jgi:4-amino-4-deoxy-L-arabinose transferase-like glycosyltransferase
MRISASDTIQLKNIRFGLFHISREKALRWGAVILLIAVAVSLRMTNLSSLGYANHYYAAGVKSMLQSWHNFFFVAAEPGA